MIDMDIIPEDEFIEKYGPCKDNTISYEYYITNKRYCIAGEKFVDLLSTYNMGRNFLMNAVSSDSWYAGFGLTDERSIIWHRHTYFLMAALLLNQCIDYFWQIIWAFLDSAELTNVKSLKNHFRKCNKKSVFSALKKIKKNKPDIPNCEIIEATNEVYSDSCNMRKNIVNAFKHRGYIFCDELESESIAKLFWKNQSSILDVEDIKTHYSLKEEEKIIVENFKRINSLIDEYEKFLNPSNFFRVTDDKGVHLCEPKDFPKWL